MSHKFSCHEFFLLLVAAALTGCGGAATGPTTVRVTGAVTYNGIPIEGANVMFQPVESADQLLASQAVTDHDGHFELSTHVGGGDFKPGIVPARYAVAVTKLDIAAISNTLSPPKHLLPKKYSNPKTSGLTADVIAGQENRFTFPLSDK